MLLNWGNSQGLNALMNSAEFIAGFADKGSGEVDLVLSRGTGSATFTRATTATTVNSAGLIVSVASGTPRSYYDPTTLAYLGYLSEGARTNLAIASQDFSDANWNKAQTTVTVNAAIAPDGTLTADKLVETAVNDIHFTNQGFAKATSSISACNSIFVKAAERTRGELRLTDQAGNGIQLPFNLTAGTISATNSSGAGFAAVSSSLQAYPNGWYRIALGVTTNAAAQMDIEIFLADASGNTIYAGDGTSGFYIWQGQMESGAAYPSTPIPTTTASVTRNADVLTYPFAGNASASVGSAYAELSTFWSSSVSIALSFAAGQFVMDVEGGASTTIVTNDGTNVLQKTGLSDMSTGLRKRAVSWGSELLITGDGLAPVNNAFDGGFGTTKISIGSNDSGTQNWFGTLRNVRIYQTQLSASQLQAVTG